MVTLTDLFRVYIHPLRQATTMRYSTSNSPVTLRNTGTAGRSSCNQTNQSDSRIQWIHGPWQTCSSWSQSHLNVHVHCFCENETFITPELYIVPQFGLDHLLGNISAAQWIYQTVYFLDYCLHNFFNSNKISGTVKILAKGGFNKKFNFTPWSAYWWQWEINLSS